MSDPVTLSAEAWAAIAVLAAPLFGALAANWSLKGAVQLLTAEMKEVKEAMSKIPNHEGRILRLETAQSRAQKKR